MASLTLLAEQAAREVAACIGCHDCLLACPIPEASLVGIAELNAAVMAPTVRSSRVARFVEACTQCGQCVPACPADLSRAAMVLYNKQKLEDAAPDRALLIHTQDGERLAPSLFTLDSLSSELARIRLFNGCAPEEVRRLVAKSTLRRLRPRDTLCKEGEYHDRLVIVVSGALEQHTRKGRVGVLVLGPGSFFGDMAVMADQPEPFSVSARTESVVLEAPKSAVQRAMQGSDALRRTLEALYARRAIHTYASRPRALGALPEAAIAALLAQASLQSLREGEVLLSEGDAPRDVFITRAGFLRATRSRPGGDEVLSYFNEGDLFGALALLLDEATNPFAVTAVGRAEVIRIPGAAFLRAMEEHPEARSLADAGAFEAERSARLQGSERARAKLPSAPVPASALAASVAQPLSWSSLVEEGLAEGREVLAIDQRRCTACNGCVEACGRRHGASRLELSGIQVGPLLFPTACRHCDDPVCLMCSVGGIVRKPGGEIAIVEESCIGCGACAERCPYGNIRMHAIDTPKPSLFERFVDFLRGPRSEERAADHDPERARKAVTCDLCAGYDDYACVTACPVGAAFRADFSDSDVFAKLR